MAKLPKFKTDDEFFEFVETHDMTDYWDDFEDVWFEQVSLEKDGTEITYFVEIAIDSVSGGYTAECLELKGCVSQGETKKEALEMIKDAIFCWFQQ